MSERVRVGVIGTSRIVENFHLPGLANHSGAELTAVCGRNQERAGELAGKFGIPKVYADYRKMIEEGELEAVIVATPDDLHHSMVMEALDVGMHVVCEKPLALNVAQAREMCEKAEEKGVKNMAFFTQRWFPQRRFLREMVDEGYVGRCLDAHFYLFAGFGRGSLAAFPPWTYDPQRCLGVLGTLASHKIDHARWYVGDIIRVSASLKTIVPSKCEPELAVRPNNAVVLTVEFENGAQGVLHISDVAYAGSVMDFSMALHGESGAVEALVSSSGREELRGLKEGEASFSSLSVPDRFWEGVDRSKPWIEQIMEVFAKQDVGDRLFIDAILEDRPISPSFRDGLKVQQVMEAAQKSQDSGTWVSVDSK